MLGSPARNPSMAGGDASRFVPAGDVSLTPLIGGEGDEPSLAVSMLGDDAGSVFELKLQITTLQQDLEAEREAIRAAEDEKLMLNEQLFSAITRADEAEASKAELTEKLRDSNSTLQSMQERMSQLHSSAEEVYSASAELHAVAQAHEETTRKLSMTRDVLHKRDVEIGTLKAERAELMGKLTSLTSEIDTLRMELDMDQWTSRTWTASTRRACSLRRSSRRSARWCGPRTTGTTLRCASVRRPRIWSTPRTTCAG